MVQPRTNKNLFPDVFYLLQVFNFQLQAQMFTLGKHRFSEIFKNWFFRKLFEKTAFLPAKSVVNTEKCENVNKFKF